MAYLKADAVKAVLEDLGMLDRGGNVSSLDSARVGLRFDTAVASFTRNDIATVNPAAIDDALFLPLVSWLVQECAPLFHKERNLQAANDAIAGLRAADRRARTVANTPENRIAVQVLRSLGMVEAGANPSPTELASVTGRLSQILTDLGARRVAWFRDGSDVEIRGAFHVFCDYVAAVLGPELGQPDKVRGRSAHPVSPRILNMRDAEAELRSVVAPDPTFAPLVVEYF